MDDYPRSHSSERDPDRTPPTGRLTVTRLALADYCGSDQQI